MSIVMLVRGVVPSEVSSFANWDSYSFSRALSSCWILADNLWHGGLKISHCFPLIYCSIINDSWFKMSDIFSLMQGEVFVSVIGKKYVDRCSALNLMDTANYVYVWISSL